MESRKEAKAWIYLDSFFILYLLMIIRVIFAIVFNKQVSLFSFLNLYTFFAVNIDKTINMCLFYFKEIEIQF